METKYCAASDTVLRRCVFRQLTAEQNPDASPPLLRNEEFSCIQRLFRVFLALSRLLLNKQYVGLNSGMKRGVHCFWEKGLALQNWEFHCLQLISFCTSVCTYPYKIVIIHLLAVTENRGCILRLGQDVKSIFSATHCSQMRLIYIFEELSTNKIFSMGPWNFHISFTKRHL